MKKINKLREIHDAGVESLVIDYNKGDILINFSIFNEITKNYEIIQYTFKSVADFQINSHAIDSDINIYEIEVKQIEELFWVKIILTLGFGKPSSKFEFKCKDIQSI